MTKHLQEAAEKWEAKLAKGEVTPYVAVTDVTPEGFGVSEETDDLDRLWNDFLAGDLSAIEKAKNI